MKYRARLAVALAVMAAPFTAHAQRQMEKLGRGVVAVNQGEGKVFVSWRMLGTEPDGIAFNVYRKTGSAAPTKLNAQPITTATCYQDSGVDLSANVEYIVRPVINGAEGEPNAPFLNKIAANSAAKQYFSIPLKAGIGVPNDSSCGDLDGDGEYEIIVKRENGSHDNSQTGYTNPTWLEAYKIDGTYLWSINLGVNIRGGAHYTQFMVYDFDGDGKAEIICKTGDGTTDGTGVVIGDGTKDWRNNNGMILQGPEYLTVFNGMTGKAMQTIPFEPARGDATEFGDNTGNRVDRFLGGVAYLDGQRPSCVMSRGYYTGRDGSGRNELAAYNWRDGKLSMIWHFKASRGKAGDQNTDYLGQGNHNLSIADVDGDGKDEIIYGAMAINSDGTPRYSTHLGHGDALHVSDMDPSRPGLEVWDIHENPRHPFGGEFRDASTGKMIFGIPGGTDASPDVGRGCAADVDPRSPGYEMWCSGGPLVRGLYGVSGKKVSDSNPSSCNFVCWWDGDLLRELEDGNHIDKWDWNDNTTKKIFTAEGCSSNNGTKSTPALLADLFGDWREEVMWRTNDNTELRIYTTVIPTEHRFYTLMHDSQYREAIAWQNVAYNQPPHPSFFLGDGMKPAPRPKIVLVQPK